MKIPELILRNAYGVVALLLFTCTLPIFTLGYALVFTLFPANKAPHIAHGVLSYNWARLIHFLFILPVRIQGKEKIDPNTTYVFVANHQSQLDIPAYALSCRNTFRFLAKEELTKIPFMGFIIRKLYLTVNRKDRADRNRSLEVMKKTLDEGISVFLCPEGTRNRKEEPVLLDFRDGAFRLAIAAQRPLAYLTVINTGRKLNPSHPIALAPGRIYAVWGDPIDTRGMTLDDVPALKMKVRDAMEKTIVEWRKQHPK